MRIIQIEYEGKGYFVIAKGDEYRPSYFSFFVDADSTSWSNKGYFAARLFKTQPEAQECLGRIRQRERERHKRRLAAR